MQNSFSQKLLQMQDHIQHCIVDAVEQDDEQALDSLCQAIDKFIK